MPRFATDAVRPHERFEFWRDEVCRTFVGLDVHAVSIRDFHGRLSARSAGRCTLVRAEGASQAVSRTERLIERDEAECAVVMLQRAGRATVHQDGRRTVLSPGHMALIDSRRPYRIEFHEAFVQDVLKAPTALLATRLPSLDALAARSVACVSVPARMLAAAFGGQDGAASDATGEPSRLESPLLELVALTLGAGCDVSAAIDPAASPRVRRAKAYILARLADPALGAEAVASAQGVSLRLLQRQFAADGTSISGWILEQRLVRAHRALQDPGPSVTDVALAHGFSDPSQFARAFRRRFGLRPSDVRHAGSPGAGSVRP